MDDAEFIQRLIVGVQDMIALMMMEREVTVDTPDESVQVVVGLCVTNTLLLLNELAGRADVEGELASVYYGIRAMLSEAEAS